MEQICKTLLKSHIHFIHSTVLQNYRFHKDASPSSNPFQFYLVRYSKNQYNKLTVHKKITFLKSSSQLFNDDFINSKIRF